MKGVHLYFSSEMILNLLNIFKTKELIVDFRKQRKSITGTISVNRPYVGPLMV